MKTRLKNEKFAEVLTRRNLSQNWLAMKIGVSSGYMSQLMTGKRAPSPNVRQRILDHLPDLTFDDLFEIVR